jgi:TolA-binding protein
MLTLSRFLCPSAGRWERARVAGLDRALSRHLGSCEMCRAAWEADACLRALAARIPVRELAADRLAAGREALLARAQAELAWGMSEPTIRRTGRRFWAPAAAAAALVVWGLWLGAARVREPARASPPARSAARIEAKRGATQVQSVLQSASGASASLDTFVEARKAGPDASPGQELPAPATGGASPSARSGSGIAPALRGGAMSMRSSSAPARSAARLNPLREPSAGGAVDSTLTSSRPLGTASEAAFREGWVALRAGHPALAAHWFASVESGSALAEDAHYWRGVSLARAARLEQAVAVLERFAARYPRSLRRSEAALVLGWVHLQRHAEKRAASYFAEAMLTDDPATRQEAAQALARINGLVGPKRAR